MKFIPIAKPIIGQEEKNSVLEVMTSGNLAQGKYVENFENKFSEVISSNHCIAVNSGTSALHIGLLALGIKNGDEVIVPSFTFAASANSIALTGATPIFADIDALTFNLDPGQIESLITARTVAIMAVHLYGQPADMNAVMKIAKKHGLKVIEDASQSHLAHIGGKNVGTFGDFGVFSFYPTKNMTSGEGGMITTNDPELNRIARLLRNQGMERRYENEIVGFNLRMTDIHAAIGLEQLKKLNGWTETRRNNAHYFNKHLLGVSVPTVIDNAFHVYHQYTIRIVNQSRNEFATKLDSMGIGTGVYYPTPVHRLKSFNLDTELPQTESACNEALSIPVHPSLTLEDLDRIIDGVNSLAAKGM